MARIPSEQIDNMTLKPREANKGTPRSIIDAANRNIAFISWEQEVPTSNSVPRVAQHDIDTCCGTTANKVQNLAYVNHLEEKVAYAQQLLDITGCDTLAQLARHVSGLTKRCEVLTQQVNQLKQELIDLDLEHQAHLDELFGTGN